jgi:hypothetical protein
MAARLRPMQKKASPTVYSQTQRDSGERKEKRDSQHFLRNSH